MNSVILRLWLGFIGSCLIGVGPVLASEAHFSFQRVADQAKKLASVPFEEPSSQVPDFLKNITYDQWRDIRFKNSKTLWGDEQIPFKVRFFHLGFYYTQPVIINYVNGTGVHPFKFSTELFDYGKNYFRPKIPSDLGFAGFRIHYPINTPDYDDEIAVFLGASYFRGLARGQGYGLSARGLAINTAGDGGEEFPFFKEFWIIKPKAKDTSVTLYALLDSQSLSGAYEFTIRPGKKTTMQVHSRLFMRKKIQKLGIAPMTSMFLYGQNAKLGNGDYRPQVHDSDGLSMTTKWGEWIWRPLINPKTILVNTFDIGTPRGFGLFQRDTNFDHYQDLESRYELRPSLWEIPQGDWGRGHVELVQIPSGDEHNDNIVAFWVPHTPPEAGTVLDFSYLLQWCWADSKYSSKGYVADTHVVEGQDGAQFIIDFQGKTINAIAAQTHLSADISITKGYKIVERQVMKNVVTGGWRLVFQIQFDKQGPLQNILTEKRSAVGLRAFLKKGSDVLTETWDYAFTP